MNITGFFHWMSGRSITSDCQKAAFSNCGSNRPDLRLARRAKLQFVRRRAGRPAVPMSVWTWSFSIPWVDRACAVSATADC